MRTFRKDTEETITLGVDWSGRMSDETISASQWDVAAGITHESSDYSDLTTDIVVSGGTEGTQYVLSNTITTTEGNIYQRSFIVQVVDR
jgi:hypothetical protein